MRVLPIRDVLTDAKRLRPGGLGVGFEVWKIFTGLVAGGGWGTGIAVESIHQLETPPCKVLPETNVWQLCNNFATRVVGRLITCVMVLCR